jgi:hypothetical protein
VVNHLLKKEFSMKLSNEFICIGIIALFGFSTFAAEYKINKNQVPDAVLQSFSKTFPNAIAENYAKETRNGKTYYEIESKEGTISRDLLFEPNGKLVEMEEKLPYDSLPAAVQDTIKTKYGKNAFVSAERITKNNQTTYGVVIKINNKKMEKTFNPDGSLSSKNTESMEEEKEPDETDENQE